MKNFKGWKSVFSFNYKQSTSSKSYIAVTVIMSVLIIAVAVILSIVAAKPAKEEEEKTEYFDIETVYVLDTVGVGELKYEEWLPQLADEYYKSLAFVTVENMTKEELQTMAAQDEMGSAVGVVIEQRGQDVAVVGVVPSTSDTLSAREGLEAAELVAACVEKARVANSGLTQFQIAEIQKTPVVSVATAGEEQNVVVYLIQYIAPAIFGLVMYFLLLIYGQNINQGVSVEKTSKLVETLLTSLHPYALLTGKVFALVATALQQFFIWVASVFVGIIAGGMIAGAMYPQTEQGLSVVVEFLRANIGETAFSPFAMVLALITFSVGFLFYCVLAGMAGSLVNRPEEAANFNSIYVMPILFSWIICYFATLMEKDAILVVARQIPFTIPFCVPVELLTGTIGIGQGIVSTVIVLVFSLLVIMLSGRIYKGLVLYNGQKVTMKNIIGVLKNKE